MNTELDRHAFLIIAHKDDLTFRTLISMLDHPRNDIFIHMDLKSKNYKEENVLSMTFYSKIYHTERTSVSWGGYSQINAEMMLLALAVHHGRYSYYHLLSGEDLPIKSQEEIHNFFSINKGFEFIRFEKEKFVYDERVRLYHLFQEKIGRKGNILIKFCSSLFIRLQNILKIDRNKDIKFQKGTNWFSITQEFASYVVLQKNWIENTFKYTFCGDEIFLQTLFVNSPFSNKLYHQAFDNDCHAIMRLIDWTRGKPYTFRIEDFEEIRQSDMLFARKFQESVDSSIIEKIRDWNVKREGQDI